MTTTRIALVAGLLGAIACEGDSGCVVTNHGRTVHQAGHGTGAFEVRGRLVDAETGKPVPRRRIWVHGFNDEADCEVSLAPDDGTSSFVLRLPERKVRLRVPDLENVYQRFEENFTAPASGPLDVEIRLEPTHWIVLHGRVLCRDGVALTPVKREGSGDGRIRMGGSPLIDIGPAGGISYDDDGNYSVRVPRELLKITTIDTSRVAEPRELDLRGVKDDARAFDVILVEWRPEPAEPPVRAGTAAHANLLLVTLDTTRADHLGCYGYAPPTSPRLDRLAREGVVVERELVAAPMTLPSHASLFSGRLPSRHGVRDNGLFRVAPDERLLAGILRDAGWRTGAFVSGFSLVASTGLDRGFEVYDDKFTAVASGGVAQLERRADKTVALAIEWLDSLKSGAGEAGGTASPWFLWLHLFDAHAPYEPPPPFADRFAQPYDGEIAFADSQLGRLCDHLAARGLLDATLVVVTADHGEGLGDHGEKLHGLFLYDSTVWVPLVLRHPALGRGVRLKGQVGEVDVLPTLLELLAVAPPPGLSGASFLPALATAAPECWHDVVVETQTPWFEYGLAPLAALSTATQKFVEAPRPELYVRGDDRGELHDLAATRPADVAAARARLDELRGGPARPPPPQQRVLGEVERARLQALGYASGDVVDPSLAGGDPKDALPLLDARAQAFTALKRRDWAEVERVLRPVVRRWPRDGVCKALLGHALLKSGATDAAIELLVEALALRPDSTGAALDLAQACRSKGEVARALAAYDQALAHLASCLEASLSAAELCAQREEWQRALDYLQGARAYLQDDAGARARFDAQWQLARRKLGLAEGDGGR